jgi:hypothetical protein
VSADRGLVMTAYDGANTLASKKCGARTIYGTR